MIVQTGKKKERSRESSRENQNKAMVIKEHTCHTFEASISKTCLIGLPHYAHVAIEYLHVASPN